MQSVYPSIPYLATVYPAEAKAILPDTLAEIHNIYAIIEKTRPLSVIEIIPCSRGFTFGLSQILYTAFIQVLLLWSVV